MDSMLHRVGRHLFVTYLALRPLGHARPEVADVPFTVHHFARAGDVKASLCAFVRLQLGHGSDRGSVYLLRCHLLYVTGGQDSREEAALHICRLFDH